MTEVPTLGMLWALCVTETPGAGPLLMAGGFIFCLEGGRSVFCLQMFKVKFWESEMCLYFFDMNIDLISRIILIS